MCLGASAGGVEACIRLLRKIPANAGVAIVIVNHRRMGPTMLPEILARQTFMPALLILEGMPLERDHIYVIPPNCDLTLSADFSSECFVQAVWMPSVVTIFLESLAKNWTGQLVAVILSGVDSDGAEALRSIKAAGGITFAQKRPTAGFPSMPQSALDTGFVDLELSPEDILTSWSALELADCACCWSRFPNAPSSLQPCGRRRAVPPPT